MTGRRGMVLAWGVGVVVTLGALVAAFRVGSVRAEDAYLPVQSLQGVARRIGLKFPPGARLVDVRYTSVLMSVNLWAVLTMPPEQARAFLAGPPFERETSEERRLTDKAASVSGISGWHPDAARKFLSAGTPYRGQWYTVHVLADLDQPDSAMVYLLWSVM